MKYINKIQTFMMGRYGLDALSNFLLKMYLILLIINIFLKLKMLSILELLILIIVIYRFLSKKIYQRNNENKIYLKFLGKISKPFTNIRRNIKDKDHIYKKCHNCKTTLKLPLPLKRGIKTSKCPGCGKKVKVLALRKVKVEVITRKKDNK